MRSTWSTGRLPKSYDQSQQDSAHRSDAVRYIRHHLGEYPGIVARRLGAIVGLYHPGEQIRLDGVIENRGLDVARAGMYSFYALALLSVAGAIALRRRRTVPVFPLLVPPVMVVVTVAAVYASTRFRAAAEVSLCLLAAIALDAGIGWHAARRDRPGEGVAQNDLSREPIWAILPTSCTGPPTSS